MSQKKTKKVSKQIRQQVARSVAEVFQKLDPVSKGKWVDNMLTTLVNMTAKQRKSFLSDTFFQKGQPTQEDLETVNQLITAFLFSVKPEYQPHYAFMIMKGLSRPVQDIGERLQLLRKYLWVHAGVKPETYTRMIEVWNKLELDHDDPTQFDRFFNYLLDNAK